MPFLCDTPSLFNLVRFSVFNFFNSNFDKVDAAFESAQDIREVHHCKKSKLQLINHPKWGAAITNGEDDGINRLPNGFRCQLPDNSVWAVKGNEWLKLSVALTDKQQSKGGDNKW
jgi:hypothetical protein